jgi:hypothetical protein
MLAVLSTFNDIFCYSQINYEDRILQTLNSFYGISYGDRYRYISRCYSGNGMNQCDGLKGDKKRDESNIAQKIKF